MLTIIGTRIILLVAAVTSFVLRVSLPTNKVKGKRGKQHVRNNRRICPACGVWEDIYQAGQVIRIKKLYHFLRCLRWEMCGYGLYCRVCSRCENCLQWATAKNDTEPAISEQLREDNCCPH
ncbi:hypothetical protein BDV37DRAFT_265629 [Aspergillus pseudonomiae]|uniref:Uncharacterized protein n=1 Tax=Aspergillus pseudonomiae TaxID=1506151 RepID=A0A5N7CTA4_9EURO|nr:uncharacterized protein BDV37DRAFT_265629 [Aspergillus pseudonomiae]KAE8397431.1 hypothetical protein BDV37DRAFT_265629 [Aspergillus pseudonomiae]